MPGNETTPSDKPQELVLHHRDGSARVRFRWNGDRFTHRVDWQDDHGDCIDADADSSWPVSPPLQQLSIESIAGSDVALGVGAAGQSHWSVSIESHPRGFRFDWACRIKQPPEIRDQDDPPAASLGIAYRVTQGLRIQPGQQTRLLEDPDQDWVRIEPESRVDQAGTYRWSYDVGPADRS